MGASLPTVPSQNIPVLDCSAGLEYVSGDLIYALKNYGFAYLANHGLSYIWIRTALSESKKFFELPENVKQGYRRKYTDFANYRKFSQLDSGYIAPYQESIMRVGDLTEDYETSREYRECYDVVFQEGQYLRFPDDVVPDFRPASLRILKAMSGLGLEILRAIGTGLSNQDSEVLVKNHHLLGKKGNVSALRYNYYPGVSETAENLDFTRTGAHASFGSVILVIQDSPGLEGTNSEGSFMNIPPIRNTILVTVGELMQRWTGDVIKAPKVRVQIPKDLEIRKRPRQSLVYYMIPDNDVTVQPLTGSKVYEPVVVGQYLSEKLVKMYY